MKLLELVVTLLTLLTVTAGLRAGLVSGLRSGLNASTQLELILFFGQSNVPGRKSINGPDNEDCLADGLDEVYAMLLAQTEYTNDASPVQLYDLYTELAPRTDAYSVGAGQDMATHLSFGRMIDRVDVAGNKRRFGLVSYGVGGTGLAVWRPDSSTPASGGNYLTRAIAYARAIEARSGGRVVACNWIGGESDALNEAQSLAVEDNLTDIHAALDAVWPGIRFLANRLGDGNSGAFKANVRAGVEAFVAASSSSRAYSDADGLVQDGGLHFTPDGYNTLGDRAGIAMLGLLGINILPTPLFTVQALDLEANFTDLSSDDGGGTIVEWLWNFGDGSTSTVQHPTHTYTVNGRYTVRLTVTDNDGGVNSADLEITVATPTWTTDATSGQGFPATQAEWNQLIAAHGLTWGGSPMQAPDYGWGFQEASGPIVALWGGKNLTFTGTASYEKTKAGIARKFVGGPGTGAATVSASNGTMPNINANSVWMLSFLDFASSTTFREQLSWGAAGTNAIQVAAGTGVRKRTGSNSRNSTLAHAGTPMFYVSVYSIAAGRDELYSQIEKVALTFGAAAGAAIAATVALNGEAAANTDFGYLVAGVGGPPTPAEVKHLLMALGCAVSGY